MNWLKQVIIAVLFIFFAILQASFFPYVAIAGAVPNLVFALFFVLIFFEPQQAYFEGFLAVLIAGLVQDIFLPPYFGISMGSLLIVYFLYKSIGHFLKGDQRKYLIFYFMIVFSLLFGAYNALLYGASVLLNFEFNIGPATLTSLAYSLVFAAAGFYVGRNIFSENSHNQLKLL